MEIIRKISFIWALVMSFHDFVKTYIYHSNQYVVIPFNNLQIKLNNFIIVLIIVLTNRR